MDFRGKLFSLVVSGLVFSSGVAVADVHIAPNKPGVSAPVAMVNCMINLRAGVPDFVADDAKAMWLCTAQPHMFQVSQEVSDRGFDMDDTDIGKLFARYGVDLGMAMRSPEFRLSGFGFSYDGCRQNWKTARGYSNWVHQHDGQTMHCRGGRFV